MHQQYVSLSGNSVVVCRQLIQNRKNVLVARAPEVSVCVGGGGGALVDFTVEANYMNVGSCFKHYQVSSCGRSNPCLFNPL